MRHRSIIRLLVGCLIPAAGVIGMLVGRAEAQPAGMLDLSWDACAPIVSNKTGFPQGSVTFFASVVDLPDSSRGYQLRWLLCDGSATVPDAWRFDDAGCNAGFRTWSALPPTALSKSCPALVGSLNHFTVDVLEPAGPSSGFPSTTLLGIYAVSYPVGAAIPAPGQRMHLASFTHDFFWSVEGPGTPGTTCGGLETPVGIQVIPAYTTWLDMDLVERTFERGNDVVSAHGGLGCLFVPARASTWGALKNQYR